MTENEERLIHKFLDKTLSEEEWDTLLAWLEHHENKKVFNSYVKADYRMNISYHQDPHSSYDAFLRSLNWNHNKEDKTRKLWPNQKWWGVAASITLLVGLALGWYYLDNPMDDASPEMTRISIEQGTDGAILTLEDGTEVKLQKGSSFTTAYANSNGEEVVYDSKEANAKNLYNTITVDRGKQFSLTLSDGTRIWLNSETKLKYPVSFTSGNTREVELIYGEAYFDVTPAIKNNGNDFRVKQAYQDVTVLGTEFNIKAYPDEDRIYTTLVEGQVEVVHQDLNMILVPYDQSILDFRAGNMDKTEVDTRAETAWRRGLFMFRNKTLGEITITLSRWYDIDIEISENSMKDVKFKGTLSKDQPLEEILELIKNTKFINDYDIAKDKVVIR